MALITRLSYPLPSLNHSNNNNFIIPTPPLHLNHHNRSASSSSSSGALTLRNKSSRLVLVSTCASNTHNQQASSSDSEDDEDYKPNNNLNDPYLMTDDERREWRSKIRQVISNIKPQDLEEEELPLDVDEKRTKMQDLLAQYPLVVEEDDPDWPEDADGWGFNLGRFFDKITIKNNPKKHNDDDDDDDYDSENEIVWQDDNYIRPIKDITASDWEHAIFKDISPLIVLVHHRYKRPKENEKIRDELEKAVQIIWNCRLPSPRCVAVDAVVETDLVSALKVSVFPELIFTKAGKILFRDKAIRTAEELSKIMAFFYYGAAKPPWLKIVGDSQEAIPSVPVNTQP